MQTILRYLAIVTLIAVIDSCAVRDHLVPETNSCQTTEFMGLLDYYLIPPGETVQIGQTVTSHQFATIPVIDILKVGDLSFAVGYPNYFITYEYDSEGRVKKKAYGGPLYSKERSTSEYTYEPGKVTETYTVYNFRPEPYVETRIHMLNSDGVEEKDNLTFVNGFITEERYSGYTIRNTVQNGNIVKKEYTSTDPQGQVGLATYEFDLSKPNPIPAFFPIFAAPSPFKLNQNMLTRVIDDSDTRDNVDPYIIEYQYIKTDLGVYEVQIVHKPNDDRITYNINGYKQSCQ
ncbi:hypothetical protein [Larkinella rosea]|uniref:DUF4595 domain-containing protein n=1 Tax=Larkinella rosea TaxID=2025312 RepID=A0A3P1BYZ2_9BACT|nr:hypothetical protein [Larkinella rosea]RRB06331.1 hypothetical protein EHT25_00555 [Larkinella rosea]